MTIRHEAVVVAQSGTNPHHPAMRRAAVDARISRRASNVETGEVVEAEPIRRDNGPSRRDGGGSNDQVVSSARASGRSDGNEELGVRTSGTEVVPDHRQAGDDVVQELAPRALTLPAGDPDPDAEFGDRDRSDGRFVVVRDEFVEVDPVSLGPDQNVRVEQEQRQNRSSAVN